jgi:DNA-binding CsgD family transcriptional regulator
VPGGVGYYGAASRYLGLLAGTMSRWEEAERHFQDAMHLDSRMGASTWLTHVQHDYAQMLVRWNSAGDRDKATSLVGRALVTARETGMGLLETRLAGLQELIKSSSTRGPVYPNGLTQREVEVLRLVASGKTDREVAAQLFISVGTVNTHVKNILYKTNASNRTEAATYAASHGLL